MTTSDGDVPINQDEVAPSPSVIKRKREDFETLNLQFPTSAMIEYREKCFLMKELVAQLLKVVKENRENLLWSELEMLKALHKRLSDFLLENLKMVANMKGELLSSLLGGEPLPKQKRLDESDEDIEGLACSGNLRSSKRVKMENNEQAAFSSSSMGSRKSKVIVIDDEQDLKSPPSPASQQHNRKPLLHIAVNKRATPIHQTQHHRSTNNPIHRSTNNPIHRSSNIAAATSHSSHCLPSLFNPINQEPNQDRVPSSRLTHDGGLGLSGKHLDFRKNAEYAKLRKKGIPPILEERLDMFSTVIATGEHAWTPSSSLPLQKDNIGEDLVDLVGDSDEVDDVAEPEEGKKRSQRLEDAKCKGVGTKKGKLGSSAKLSQQIDRMVEAFESKSTASSMITKKLQEGEATSITSIMNLLKSIPGMGTTTPLWHFATDLILNKEMREILANMKDDPEGMKSWLVYQKNKN